MMTDFWLQWLLIVGVFSVALISPGPDFIMAVRNSMISRAAGLWTAVGFAFGVVVHVTYCVLGIAVLISKSVLLFNAIKWVGAAYLCWIGYHALKSKGFHADIDQADVKKSAMSPMAAFRSGFLTNALNPKASLFFLALFTQVIDPHTPVYVQAVYGLTCCVMVWMWFSVVALVLTQPKIRGQFLKISQWIDRACGAVLLALGVKLALTKLN